MKWEENVRKVVPYVAGEQPNRPNMIKLNTNECPYPPAPGVRQAAENMESASLRLYPNSNAQPLVDALAAYYHVKPEQVFVGVGSDDVLSMAFLTFFNSGKPILFPDVTYSFYDVWADLYRIPYRTCALDENWHMNPEDYKQPNGGVIFPNPNAPTGVEESLEMIEEILQANPDVVVIVDEAYVDFGGKSALPLLKKYENLLVVQTFSKSRAMAGMRIGFCIGNEKLIHYLNDVKFSFNSYTMNLPSQVMGVEAVRMMFILKRLRRRSWRPESALRRSFRSLDLLSRILRRTLSSLLIRKYLPKSFFLHFAQQTSMSDIGTKKELPTPCVSQSVRMKRWTV